MARPIFIAETPNAGARGGCFLASQDGVSQRQAAAFVARGRGTAEAVGHNYLAVRRLVERRATSREAPSVLVLAGIDARGMEPERRAALLKKLHSFLPEVEYAADQIDWTKENRRVVPSSELAGLIDLDISSLPPADATWPKDGNSSGAGLWIALGAVLLVAIVIGVIVSSPKKAEEKPLPIEDNKGKKDEKPRPPTPAEAVQTLRQRVSWTSDLARLEAVEKEVARLRGDPAYGEQAAALDRVAGDARKKREGILRQQAEEREAVRLQRVERDKKRWPGTEPKVRELGRDEKYLDAARVLGEKNEAFPREWERLRDWLGNEVRLQLKARAKALTEEDKFDEARTMIGALTRAELLALDPEIKKAGQSAVAALDGREDRYRYETILEGPPAEREKNVRAYLRSQVARKRGKREAARMLRWLQGDWPRPVSVSVAAVPGMTAEGLMVDGKAVIALPGRVTAVFKAGESLKVQTTKGAEKVTLDQLLGGISVLGVRLAVPGMTALPKYDELPAPSVGR